MPELKNTFTGGKMDKDQDERILDNRSYREALNIEVFTTEDSDIGSAQNILGNIKVTHAIQGPKNDYVDCGIEPIGYNRYQGTNKHIAHTVDPQSDKLYRFINTEPNNQNNHGIWMDRIVEYDTNANIQDNWNQKEKAVMVDVYKVGTNISSIDAPPPPPPGGKFWCNNGNCEPCNTAPPGTCTGGQPGANYATLQDCQNDPAFCGGATRGGGSCNWTAPSPYTAFQCAPVPGASCRNKWAWEVSTNSAFNNPATNTLNPPSRSIDIRDYVVKCQNNERGVYGGPQGSNKIWKGTGWSVRPYSTGAHTTIVGGTEGAALNDYVASAAFTSSSTQEVWYRWGKTGGVWYDKGQTLPNGISISQLDYFAGGYSQTPGITFFIYQELLDFLENWLNIPGASTLPNTVVAQPNFLNNMIDQGSYGGNQLIAGRIIIEPNRLELA